MNIGRRRIVLVEKVSKRKVFDISESSRQLTSVQTDTFRKNRFFMELERNDGVVINPYRICGFKIERNVNSSVLKVKTTIDVKGWVLEYEKVVVARIFLYDANGNDLNNMDLDVSFRGYSIECDYSSEEVVKPVFSYAIIGE
jgi:hypothetical protein